MKNWTSVLMVVLLGACGHKAELSVKDGSRQVCDCFSANAAGTVDERLSPCLQRMADTKNKEWNDSGFTNSDSIRVRMSKFSLDIMVELTRSCDNYFIAVNDLYDKGYSLDTTLLNRNAIMELSKRIKTESNKDSIKSMLHKKAYKLIQAREFDLALQSIDSIKSFDKTDYGANLASAYIFNQTGLHDQAVIEIKNAIEVSGNGNLKLYAEIARQKKRTSKK